MKKGLMMIFILVMSFVSISSYVLAEDLIQCDPQNPVCPEGHSCKLYDGGYYCGLTCPEGQHLDDNECVLDQNNHDIPEFTAIGGGIALLGAAGYALYRRRK